MIVATIRVRTPSGAARTFAADRVDIDHGLITASGIWRGTRDRKRRTYTWPHRQLVEVCWTRERAMA
jgi:hypothetical protein